MYNTLSRKRYIVRRQRAILNTTRKLLDISLFFLCDVCFFVVSTLVVLRCISTTIFIRYAPLFNIASIQLFLIDGHFVAQPFTGDLIMNVLLLFHIAVPSVFRYSLGW